VRALLASGALHAPVAAHASRLGVLVVYVEEAHACDEWPVSSARDAPKGAPVAIPAHRCPAEREAAARALLEDFDVPESVLCATDSFQTPWRHLDADDEAWFAGGAERAAASGAPPAVNFQNAYSAWPFRWALLRERAEGGAAAGGPWVCARMGHPDGAEWHLEELAQAVEEVVREGRV
jgi:hypothetical protein